MLTFPAAFPLVAHLLPAEKRPAVAFTQPENCRPSSTFDGGPHGVATGPRNGFFVVDVDRKPGRDDGVASLTTYAGERELPETYTVRTPSGGLHLYFAWDAERPVRNSHGILPGVDVRGICGFVAAGGAYKVLVDAPIAAAPAWLFDLVGRRVPEVGDAPTTPATAIGPEHPEYAHRVALAEAYIAAEPPCLEGEGKSEGQTFKMALRLSRTYELPTDVSLTLLEPYLARCRPAGYVREKLARALVRAAEHGQGPTGTFSAAFLSPGAQAGGAAPLVPAPEDWKQVRNPKHVYSVDLSMAIGGEPAQNRLGPQKTAAAYTGPGALEMWRGVWQYDAFRRRLIAVNPPFRLSAETTGLDAADLATLQVWMAAHGGQVSIDVIRNALLVAGRQAEFHPVREYLDALPRPTVTEAARSFAGIAGRLWGAEERDDLESGHLRRLAIAAVRRIRAPGTKVDSMLVLAGEQGHRKSLFCSRLFGDFYLDQVPNLEKDKEASIAIEGFWGIEFAEFRALRANEATKKDFISRCVDKYRPVWASQIQIFPRQCVMLATTNQDDFLTDPTGDGRYDVCDVRRPIRCEDFDRDAFWAAANALEASGETHWRDRALVRANEETSAFTSEHPWTDKVLKYAAGLRADEAGERWVTATQALSYGLVLATEKQDEAAANFVKGILRRAYGTAHVRSIEGRAQRAYRVARTPRPREK